MPLTLDFQNRLFGAGPICSLALASLVAAGCAGGTGAPTSPTASVSTRAAAVATEATPGSTSITAVDTRQSLIVGGNSTTGIVTLAANAPTGGNVVTLSTNDSRVGVPQSVVVPAGTNVATFAVTTNAVAYDTRVTITATSGGETRQITVTLQPVVVQSLRISPSVVRAGDTATATVTVGTELETVVQLTSNGEVSIPSSVTIPANRKSVSFTVTTRQVRTTSEATITATARGTTSSAQLRIVAGFF
jgi:hypothetical protein